MIRTEDGRWVIAERKDNPYDPRMGFDVPPSECQRCGVRVYSAAARDLHDGFHERAGA